MSTAAYAALLGFCYLFYFAVYPIYVYFKDPKGMAGSSNGELILS